MAQKVAKSLNQNQYFSTEMNVTPKNIKNALKQKCLLNANAEQRAQENLKFQQSNKKKKEKIKQQISSLKKETTTEICETQTAERQ